MIARPYNSPVGTRVETFNGKLHVVDRTHLRTARRPLTSRESRMYRVFKRVPKF